MASDMFPDYELDDKKVLTGAAELKALAHPLRTVILDLLLERAATITELAEALKRPKSTVAHHVTTLVASGMLKVVGTRRVRAIEERFYGRTARLFFVGEVAASDVSPPPWANSLQLAARESDEAYRADTMWANTRHARISRSTASQFWARVETLLEEFAQLSRDGDQTFGFATGLYPTDHPTLPPRAARTDPHLREPC